MTDERESGWTLDPKYDANGLLTAVITDEADGKGSTCMLLAAIPGTVGDGRNVAVTNTLGTATKTVTTRVGKVGELKRLLAEAHLDIHALKSVFGVKR